MEILNLDPKRIRRIDYYDQPTPRYPLASVLIEFTVDLPEHGGRMSGNHREGVTAVYGEHNAYAKFYQGVHAFAVNWNPQFRRSFSQMRERRDEFRFPTGTVTRTEEAIPARHIYWHNQMSAAYSYAGKKVNLQVAGFGKFDKDWNSDFSGRVITKTSLTTDTVQNHEYSNSRNMLGGLSLYSELTTPIGPVYLNGDYSRMDVYYNRIFREETQSGDFLAQNSVRENVHQTGLQLNYTLPIPLGGGWVGLTVLKSRWQCRWLLHQYSSPGAEATLDDMLHNGGVNSLAFIVAKGSSLMLAAILNHHWDYRNLEMIPKKSLSRFVPGFHVGYTPFPVWKVSLDLFMSTTPPSLGQLTAAEYALDPFQYQRGNPMLRPDLKFQITLNNSVELSNSLELWLQCKYQSVARKVASATYLEQATDGTWYAVRQPMNMDNYTELTLRGYIRGANLWGFLSFELSGGAYYFDNDARKAATPYRYRGWEPVVYTELGFTYRAWNLLGQMWYGEEDAFFGEMRQQRGVTAQALLSYKYKNVSLGLGVMNPFMRFKDTKQENLSPVAPYERFRYNEMYNSLVFGRLVYSFSWGKRPKASVNPELQATEQESAIIRSER